MKFIDKKGKLFGVINIIDLAIVLIIAAGVVVMYQGREQITAKKKDQTGYTKDYYIKVLFVNVPEYLASAMNKGDRDTGTKSEIVKIEKTAAKHTPKHPLN